LYGKRWMKKILTDSNIFRSGDAIVLCNSEAHQSFHSMPEGWQASTYDLDKHKWIDQGGWIHGSLKEAKTDVQEEAAAVLGKKLPETKWH
jgi:hypothetical protein